MNQTDAIRTDYDVIIVGGSYSGLAAGMALGRALRRVLIIDGGDPCNRHTPHSHNFITQDGKAPAEIAALARQQVEAYGTVEFAHGFVSTGAHAEGGFVLGTDDRRVWTARKLIFATGIKDKLPLIYGMAECWGISVLHCPYCHGYEVRTQPTGVIANGDAGFEFAALIANWTDNLTVLTNGASSFSEEQSQRLSSRGIKVVEKIVRGLEHHDGHLREVVFEDKERVRLNAMYIRPPFDQHSDVPAALGCELSHQGYIKVAPTQATTVYGLYACGDNASVMRTVANAAATGTTAGMMANKELALEEI